MEVHENADLDTQFDSVMEQLQYMLTLLEMNIKTTLARSVLLERRVDDLTQRLSVLETVVSVVKNGTSNKF